MRVPVLLALLNPLSLFAQVPEEFSSDEDFLNYVQKVHMNYMWDGAEPNSGLAPERIHLDGYYPQEDSHIVTTGGSGFGIAGLLVGIDRGFIDRNEGVERLHKIVDFLAKADRFHGVWPHWIDGKTGNVKPFSKDDDGGDLVESSFLMQGLLCVRQYFQDGNKSEKLLAKKINTLWKEMEFDWYTKGENVLYWHWSPNYQWKKNFALKGYNECLITYILGASSPTHSISPACYHEGWARGGQIQSTDVYKGLPLILNYNGSAKKGGPLFWAHYSYIGLNPLILSDKYADYGDLVKNHAMTDYLYCVENPNGYKGYGKDCWGLTASYSIKGYIAHSPLKDMGVITPTAALSSFPYTPKESMQALKGFWKKKNWIWGKYGFYDAFSETEGWTVPRYLAIDQCTIAPMIENYRTGLLWNLFMSCPEIQKGLKKLGFTYHEASQMDKFIDELMSKMTLQEKLGQLNLPVTGNIVTGQTKSSDVASKIMAGQVGGLFNLKGADKIKELQKIAVEQSRLGIPLLFGMDVIHGYETVFPIPLALACTWDTEAIYEAAQIAAKEASSDGICWTYSPMADISRDPRWGRMSEGSGEDPFLAAAMTTAMVKGYQGSSLQDKNTILSCLKHFALYGAPMAGRDYNSVDMSHLEMFNSYFPPYKAAIDAGVGSVMSSFNDVDGIPASGNKWLMTDVLRNKWGFRGFVVTDYTAIAEMTAHGLGNLKEVSALALRAGVDMDMVSDGFLGTLEKSLNDGSVTQEQIDNACRRILVAKYKLGLFSDPYKYCSDTNVSSKLYTQENRLKARKLARESFVLLKNENQLLPLSNNSKIALVGPLANTRANMPGTWSVAATSEKYSTLLEAMQNVVAGKGKIYYAKGCNLVYDDYIEANATMFGRTIRDNRSNKEMMDEAIEVARKADIIVAAMGESSEMSGECSSRSDLTLPDSQMDLLKELLKLNKPIVFLNFSGRSTIMGWEHENVSAILNVWFGGSEAADAICDVIFGKVSPSGKLVTSFPKNMGQIPLYYNHKNTGRPSSKWFTKFTSSYLDIDNEPLYPFGYGLSYTKFDYSNLEIDKQEMNSNSKIKVSVSVKNSGQYEADEVVQLYLQDVVCSITRPVKELKGFKRIHLLPGQEEKVSFEIDVELLKFYDASLKHIAEPGEFKAMVGPNSKNLHSISFWLK